MNISADGSGDPDKELFINFNRSDPINQVRLFEELNKEVAAFLTKETNDKEVTEVIDFLSTIFDSVQKEFFKIVSDDSDKKRFLKALSRIFMLLLITKVDTAEKIKRIIKIAIETTLKIWQEPRQQ